MLQQHAVGAFGMKILAIQRLHGHMQFRIGQFRGLNIERFGNKQFSGGETAYLTVQFSGGAFAMELGNAKDAGGDIAQRHAPGVVQFVHGDEIIIPLVIEERWLGNAAGGDHAHDFAAHDALGRAGIFHLLGDGDLDAATHELGQVVLQRVIGDAGQRHRFAVHRATAR